MTTTVSKSSPDLWRGQRLPSARKRKRKKDQNGYYRTVQESVHLRTSKSKRKKAPKKQPDKATSKCTRQTKEQRKPGLFQEDATQTVLVPMLRPPFEDSPGRSLEPSQKQVWSRFHFLPGVQIQSSQSHINAGKKPTFTSTRGEQSQCVRIATGVCVCLNSPSRLLTYSMCDCNC